MAKFIFVTGGVISGIGKGISAASVGRLLKDRGYSVFMQKFDPYLNVDPGTMSPYQHGEVFVTKDGGETDLDLGHYERFIDEELTKNSSITSGRIYSTVIRRERAGEYGGKTVQVIPHVTDVIKEKVFTVAEDTGADFIITEIGGTVGDIESQPFVEAIRQIHSSQPDDVMYIHTVLIPTIPASNELKTKPAQHSFKELMSYGIKPDVFILRAQEPITDEVFQKISLFCDLPREAIIESKTVDLIYEVPLVFHQQNLDTYILKHFGLKPKANRIDRWEDMCREFKAADKEVHIALVGKYTKLRDAYLSVYEALTDAGYNLGARVSVDYIDSESLTRDSMDAVLKDMDGIVVPGGFGNRGIQGMLNAIEYARVHDKPFLGICLGMQLTVIEACRNELGWKEANSTEFVPDATIPVLHLLPDQENKNDLGGTLRLGNQDCHVEEGSLAHRLYGRSDIVERHRHRYEVNSKYVDEIEKKTGLHFSGEKLSMNLMEIVERPDLNYFIASQFHPEFRSRPNSPHPLFTGLIRAAMGLDPVASTKKIKK